MENENQIIEQITKAYEEKIANREKEILKEKESIKNEMQEQFKKEKEELIAQHNKDIADIITGRKEYQDVQKKETEKQKNEDKSFFEIALEKTREKLGITKGEK